MCPMHFGAYKLLIIYAKRKQNRQVLVVFEVFKYCISTISIEKYG